MENNEFGLVLTPGFLQGQDTVKLTDSYYALQKAASVDASINPVGVHSHESSKSTHLTLREPK